MEIAGLPMHFLVVHAAVVFTPLAAAFALVFAVVPKWRYLTRWPTAVTAVIAFGAVWVARLSGTAFLDDNPGLGQSVSDHQRLGQQLSLLMILFVVLVVLAVWALGGASGLSSGRGGRESQAAALDKVLPTALVLAALLVLVWVVLTGDAGSRAVWGGVTP
ncbi:MAG: hypothetical protein HOQ22_17120 [Nocardioidaceae bacterium]|nr:hypothetical protein [Nocardioidaceae bacterium]NUS52746.1 hypothetical protein [Nocardioidaceae bacterium]